MPEKKEPRKNGRYYKFVPKDYEGDGKDDKMTEFDGHIILRCPTFGERMRYMKDCGIGIDSKGQMKAIENPLEQIEKMVELSRDHYKEIKVTHNNGSKYKSYDDLAYDPDCDKILAAVGGLILKGFRPSPNL